MPKFQTTISPIEYSIEAVERVPRAVLALTLKTAPSLKPGVAMIEAAATGQPEACAIRDAWAFNLPIKIMSRLDFARMVLNGLVSLNA